MTQHAQSLLLHLIVLCQAGPSLTAGLAPPLQGTHSLCYDFIINSKPAPGQQWCTVQGQVDHKNFLSYDCGLDKVRSMSALGGKVNATVTWEDQNTMLREMGDTLKQQLADIKAENGMARGPSTTTPDRVSQESTASTLIPSVLLLILTCFIHLGLQIFLTDK